MALVISSALGAAATILSVNVLAVYGWGLFVALPFCLGFFSVLLHGYHRPRSLGSCLAVASLSVLLIGLLLLGLAVEGVICLAMAAPIGLILALMGGSMGYSIQRRHWDRFQTRATFGALLLFVPFLMGTEALKLQAAATSSSHHTNRNQCAAGDCVAVPYFFSNSSSSYRMAFPSWNRLSDSIHTAGNRAGSTAGMPIFDRPVHRTDSSVARKRAPRIYDIRRTIGDGRIVTLWPYSYATHRWRVFSGGRGRVRANASAGRPHPAYRHFAL